MVSMADSWLGSTAWLAWQLRTQTDPGISSSGLFSVSSEKEKENAEKRQAEALARKAKAAL